MAATNTRPKTDLSGCPCMGGTLDKLIQPAILTVLSAGPMHGYGLAERIGAMPGFDGQKPDVSGIYRFLKAMEGKLLVTSAWDISGAGPAKKTYQITSQGRRCLHRWVQTLEQHHQTVAGLLKAMRKAVKKA
jgi:PadR family transcriptional regulator, regulatory protein PadR